MGSYRRFEENYTEDELWNDAMSYTHPYIPVLVDMNAYAGKSVKVAFRYVGQSGESMLIDEVTIGAVTPVASYERPAGTFYAGLSYDFMNLKSNFLYGPRKQELTWYNTTEVASSYSWEYADPSDVEQMLTSSDANLVTPVYEEDVIVVNAPALTASVGSSNSTPFKLTDYMQYGGNVFAMAESGDLINMDACIFNYPAYMRDEIRMSSGDVFGYNSDIDATWSRLLGETCTLDGVGTIIEKPKAPYALSYCFVRLYGDAISDNTVFKATVYRLTDEGTIGEELASGTTTKAEFYRPSPESWMTAIFQFEKKTGLFTEPVSLTVDYPIVIKLSAEVTDTDNFSYAGMFDPEESTGQSYVFLKDAQGQTIYVPTTALTFTMGSDGSTATMTDFSISFDAAFTWVDCEENSYEAPEEGGSKTFNVSSYYELSEAVATIEGEGLNDWYTVTPGEFNAETAITPVEVTVKALPAGTDVRASSFTIAIPGSSKTFWLAQRSADSVEGVEAATTTVAVVDGDFVVTSANASAVAVYNVAGQKVAEAAVSGKTVVPGAGLANGMYILKFNDNTVVKVVK